VTHISLEIPRLELLSLLLPLLRPVPLSLLDLLLRTRSLPPGLVEHLLGDGVPELTRLEIVLGGERSDGLGNNGEDVEVDEDAGLLWPFGGESGYGGR
jgi:hypothetical protein